MREIWKWILFKLRIRLYTPPPFGKRPMFSQTVPDIGDTGGGGWYRPPYRMQDPSEDPAEPKGGESSSAGNDHGWSNCTMSSGAMAAGFATGGDKVPWGGDMRHRQGDLSGGTDLYDLDSAFASLGVSFSVKSGTGWAQLEEYRNEGRAIVIQGTGNVPGSESFDGGHACVILPETNSDGKWLWGDPLATGWQWVSESSIKEWAQRWNSSISYGITSANPPPEPEPEPEPDPYEPAKPYYSSAFPHDCTPAADAAVALARDKDVQTWLDYIRQNMPGDVPQPVYDAVETWSNGPGFWGDALWRRNTYQDPPPPPANAARWDVSVWPVVEAAWV